MRRNSILKRVIEGRRDGRMEGTGRWGRRSKELLDGINPL